MVRPSKRYLHCLTNSIGQSYYTDGYDNDGNAVVKLSTTPKWLSFSPKNWKDINIAFGRDINKYHGINRNFTDPYELVNDGADIIRYLIYTKGYEEKVYLIILEHDDETDTYEGFYKGQVDFKQIVDDTPASVTINILEGGYLALFNANDETDYEFGFADGIDIVHDGVELRSSFVYQVLEIEDQLYLNHIIPLIYQSNEGMGSGISANDQLYEQSSSSYSSTSSNNAYENDEEQEVEIAGEIKVTLTDSSGNNRLVYQPGYMIEGDLNFTFLTPSQIITDGNTATFTILSTVTVPDGKKLFIGGRAFVNTPGDGIPFTANWETTTLRISLSTLKAPTVIKAFRPLVLCEKLIGKITGDPAYTVSSELLNTYGNLVVTSGDAIRGIETATLKTSFSKFFRSFNAILMTSWSIKGLVGHFESRKTVYNNSTVNLDSGEVSDLVIEMAKELLFNTIKVGYANQSYEDLNGRLEFNTTMGLSTPASEKKELDLRSDYRADPYGIEYLRINLEGKVTTDDSSDNDVFIINVKDRDQISGLITFDWDKSSKKLTLADQSTNISYFPIGSKFQIRQASQHLFGLGFYTVESATAVGTDLEVVVTEDTAVDDTSFTGVLHFMPILNRDVTLLTGDLPATIYNIPLLTPKQMLLRHGSWIRSVLFKMGGQFLVFETLDKNKELSYILDGVTIIEKANVQIDTLETELFYPFILSSRTRVDDNFNTVMKAAVNAHIEQSFNGRPLYGFPINMSVRPVFNPAQDWKLLASMSNDLNLFLNFEPLVINTEFMATYNLSIPHLCPVQFTPVVQQTLPQYNTIHMDAGLWKEQITTHIQKSPYKQKWQTNDIIKIQCYTNDLGPAQIDVYDLRGNNVATIPMTVVTTNAFSNPYILYQCSYPLDDLTPGTYLMVLQAGTGEAVIKFFSECLDVQVIHPNTKLFNYTNRKNKLGTIFTEGYNPDFRIEADLTDYLPKLNFSSYEDEPADMELIEAIPYDTFSLQVGRNTVGLPHYMIKKLNAIMGLTTVYIDGVQFTRDEDAQFEAERINGVAGAWYTLAVRKGVNRQESTMGSDGNVSSGVAVIYNINAELFGDLSGQVSSNPVQIETVENIE